MKTTANLLIIIILCISTTYAQVGINFDNSAPHISAQLDVKSTTKAFYPPRMTTAQKNAIGSVQPGATVFDITLNQLSYYNGSGWVNSFTIPFSSVLNSTSNLLYLENTNTSLNLPTILGVSNSSTIAAGITGSATNTAPTNNTAGLRGINKSSNSFGYGVQGIHEGVGTGGYFSSATGNGLIAVANASNSLTNTSAIIGTNNSINILGSGIKGEHLGGGIGVLGQVNEASGGIGVKGIGGATGVDGTGRYEGVQGSSDDGTGVRGVTINGLAVRGLSYGSGGTAADFSALNGGYALLTFGGNVGIGTGNPTAKMDIMGSVYRTHFYFGANEDTYIRGGKAGSHVIINDIAGQGNVGVGLTNPGYILDVNKRIRIRHTVDDTPDDNTAGIWYNNSSNVEGAFSGMKADTEVGLFLGGNWRFWVNSSGAGYLNGALIQTSDKRLKKDFIQLNNSLTDIYKINGYHFKWIEEARNKDLQTGLIAQEVQKIFPELVQTDDKGFLSVNYIGLIPHLLEAVKELKNENEMLKTNNKSVESRLEKLEQLLEFSAKK